MKRTSTFSALAVILFLLNGYLIQSQTITYSDSWNKAGYTILEQSRGGVDLQYSIQKFTFSEIDLNGRTMKNISLPDHWLPNDEGAPDLPGSGKYIAIPEGSTPVLTINSMRIERYSGIEIAPAMRIPWDDVNQQIIYQENPEIYGRNAFYPESPVKMSDVMEIRGVNAVILGITPFQYNPVTKELLVYRDIDISIDFEGGNGVFGEERLRSRFWDPILSDQLLNYSSLPKIDYAKKVMNRSNDGWEYVIIVPDGPEFYQYAEDIREFRIKQGITTKITTLTEIGGNTANQIETYINEAYNNWDPAPVAFLLLADYGTNQTNSITSPIWDNYCVSDNIYADVNNDDMPEVILARITANNADQLETMVTKFLDYEMDPPTNPSFYNNPITALGFQTERWFQICSESVAGFYEVALNKEPVRINAVYQGSPQTDPWSTATNTQTVVDVFGPNGLGYIPATPGQVPCTWNGSSTDITNAINNGAFALTHRDHGAETGWGEPAYSNSNISSLVNTDLTFVFSINCLTGKYNWSSECFTEKFHRHTNNNVNSGALGLIAASEVSYSFVNDTYVWGMYDNMWPEFMPQYGTTPESRGILPAFGNAAGKYFLQQSSWPYNTSNKEVTYNLFHHHGDAFLQLYSEVPQDLTIIHDGVILAALDEFTMTADEGATICFTVGDEIIGLATGTGMPQIISILPQSVGTIVTITVTKQNYFRHEEDIEVIPAEGPYCIYGGHIISDTSGNNNGLFDYGEEVMLNFTLKNVGLEDGENVSVTISSTDPYITIIDSENYFGTVPSDSSVTVDNAFCISVNDAVPDQHKVFINCIATNDTLSWESIFAINVNAPDLHINSLAIDDSENGNGDGELDPGEQVTMTLNVTNTGHAVAYNVNSYLEGQSGFVEVLNPNQLYSSIGFFGVFNKVFDITVDEDAPEGIVVKFMNELTMEDLAIDRIFDEKISAKFENFETGNFTKFPWENAGNQPWEVSNQYPYAGMFSARSGVITDGQNSELKIDYVVMVPDSIIFTRKVSSEDGDKLQFFIGTTKMGEWSGTTTGWVRESFPVTAGSKTFRWVYTKNGSASGGADRAWIDNIYFPTPMCLTIWAGPNEAICADETFINTAAYGTDYQTAEWVSSGTGTFENNATVNAEYTPSAEDIENGEVTLTLTLWNAQADTVQDEMILTINNVPGPPPTPEGPDWIDLLVTTTSEYTTEGIEGLDEYAWYITPPEAGTIEGIGLTGTVTWNPEYLGTAVITVAAFNQCGEGVKSEGFEVTVGNSVGIDPLAAEALEVIVAPNPSTGIFNLKILNSRQDKLNIRILNILGAEVYSRHVQTDGDYSTDLNINNLPDGVYFLTVEGTDSLITKKILKR